MRDLPEVAFTQRGTFSRAQALAAGWTDTALLHAVRVERIARLYRGVYADADLLTAPVTPADHDRQFALRSAAAVLAVPASVASHRSSLALAGLPLLGTPDRPCITVTPRYTGDAERIHLHRAELRRDGHVLDEWPRRTSTARTIIDVARECGAAAAVVAADAALRRHLTSARELRDVLDDCRQWPRIRRARLVPAFADGRSESPLESVSRLAIHRMDLPAPTLQANIYDIDGRFLGRVDFLWERAGLVGEADGAGKYGGPEGDPLHEEKVRQDRLEDVGLVVTRWGWREAHAPAELAERLYRTYARAKARPISERRWVVRPG